MVIFCHNSTIYETVYNAIKGNEMNKNPHAGGSMTQLPMNINNEAKRRTEILNMIPVLQSLSGIYRQLAGFLVLDNLAKIRGLELSKIDVSRLTHIGRTIVNDYKTLSQTQSTLLKSIEGYCAYLEPIINKPTFSIEEADMLVYLGGNIYADFQIWGENVNTLLIANANDLLEHIRQACVDPEVIKPIPFIVLN